MRGPSLTGLGKRPDLTPAHQVDLDANRAAFARETLCRLAFGQIGEPPDFSGHPSALDRHGLTDVGEVSALLATNFH